MSKLFPRSLIIRSIILIVLLSINTHYISAGELKEEAEGYRKKAYEAQQIGDIDTAMAYYQKATSLDPAYATPHNDLGILYETKGWLDRAESEYQKALAISPDYEQAHTNLALLYEKKGELEKAAFHWMRRYKAGDPDDRWTQEAKLRLEKLGLVESKGGLQKSGIKRKTVASEIEDLREKRIHDRLKQRKEAEEKQKERARAKRIRQEKRLLEKKRIQEQRREEKLERKRLKEKKREERLRERQLKREECLLERDRLKEEKRWKRMERNRLEEEKHKAAIEKKRMEEARRKTELMEKGFKEEEGQKKKEYSRKNLKQIKLEEELSKHEQQADTKTVKDLSLPSADSKNKAVAEVSKKSTKGLSPNMAIKEDMARSLELAEARLREEQKKSSDLSKKNSRHKLNPETKTYYNQARKHYKNGEYAGALDVIRKAKAEYPNDETLLSLEEEIKTTMKGEKIQDHYTKGIMLYQKENLSGARKEFEAIMDILPE